MGLSVWNGCLPFPVDDIINSLYKVLYTFPRSLQLREKLRRLYMLRNQTSLWNNSHTGPSFYRMPFQGYYEPGLGCCPSYCEDHRRLQTTRPLLCRQISDVYSMRNKMIVLFIHSIIPSDCRYTGVDRIFLRSRILQASWNNSDSKFP